MHTCQRINTYEININRFVISHIYTVCFYNWHLCIFVLFVYFTFVWLFTECPPETYGPNCLYICGESCLSDTPCNRTAEIHEGYRYTKEPIDKGEVNVLTDLFTLTPYKST
jgi:hypothetical protein